MCHWKIDPSRIIPYMLIWFSSCPPLVYFFTKGVLFIWMILYSRFFEYIWLSRTGHLVKIAWTTWLDLLLVKSCRRKKCTPKWKYYIMTFSLFSLCLIIFKYWIHRFFWNNLVKKQFFTQLYHQYFGFQRLIFKRYFINEIHNMSSFVKNH